MKLRIIFLACHVVHEYHGLGRPFNLTKKEVIKLCYGSLINSIKVAKLKDVNVTIVGDRLDEEMVSFFSETECKIINGNFGLAEAHKIILAEAIKEEDDTWIYVCEDDYLHKKESLDFVV